jgi:hypothetical protein
MRIVMQPKLIMRHYKKETIPEHIEEKLTHITCDICGDEIKSKQFDATRTEVEMWTGSSYPEGGCGERIQYDICGDCFKGELIPWLESKGAKREWEEWDF